MARLLTQKFWAFELFQNLHNNLWLGRWTKIDVFIGSTHLMHKKYLLCKIYIRCINRMESILWYYLENEIVCSHSVYQLRVYRQVTSDVIKFIASNVKWILILSHNISYFLKLKWQHKNFNFYISEWFFFFAFNISINLLSILIAILQQLKHSHVQFFTFNFY